MGGIVSLTWTDRLYVSGRDTAPYLTGRYLGALQHQSARGDYCPLTHHTVIKQCCPHAYQSTVTDGTGVYRHVVTYSNITAYMCGTRLMSHVNARAILHIGSVAYGDGSNIPTHHGIEPN